jgi:hypothetical protein
MGILLKGEAILDLTTPRKSGPWPVFVRDDLEVVVSALACEHPSVWGSEGPFG